MSKKQKHRPKGPARPTWSNAPEPPKAATPIEPASTAAPVKPPAPPKPPPPPKPPAIRMASTGGPWWLRTLLLVLGCWWITCLGGMKVVNRMSEHVPAVPRFFLQCSCLFPNASVMRIDYRIEAYSCATRHFVELDYRPYFPIEADDKESELDRIGFFYHDEPNVLAEVDQYLVDQHNARAGADADPGDGVVGPIGGIRFLSLRIPLPPLGAHVERYRRMPLTEVPREERKQWYMTDPDVRQQRCGGSP